MGRDADRLRTGSASEVGMSGQALQRALRHVVGCVERDEFPGAVVLVARHGVVVAHQAFGWADVEDRVPMRLDTIFRLASITKPVTATCVLLLVEEGRLRLDDPVARFLPPFKGQRLKWRRDRTYDVTVRQLLTHTSGLPRGGVPWPRPIGLTLERVVGEAAQMELDFEPGTAFQYSNAGYSALGRLVEVVSGRSLEEFMRDRLFGPLGMGDTAFRLPQDRGHRVASAYQYVEGRRERFLRYDPEAAARLTYIASEGGLYSTARDTAAFFQMFLNGGRFSGKRILAPETARLMTEDHTPALSVGRGLGWILARGRGDVKSLSTSAFMHGGSSGTFGWGDPERGLLGIFLTQRWNIGWERRAAFATLVTDAVTEEGDR